MADTLGIFNKFGNNLKSISRETIGGANYLLVDNIQGNKMYFPRNPRNMSWGILFFGCWEPIETEWVKKVIRPGMTVIDVGCWIGYYSLLFAKLVGKEGLVYSFDIDNNGLITLGNSSLVNNYNNIFCNNMLVNNSENKLDKLSFKNRLVDFIKIDVDGNDLDVLFGAENYISVNKDIIIMLEYCPYLWGSISKIKDFFDFIDKHNFFVRKISNYQFFDTNYVNLVEVFCEKYDNHEYQETLLLCRNKDKLYG